MPSNPLNSVADTWGCMVAMLWTGVPEQVHRQGNVVGSHEIYEIYGFYEYSKQLSWGEATWSNPVHDPGTVIRCSFFTKTAICTSARLILRSR